MILTNLNERGLLQCIDQCPKCGAVTRTRCVDSRMDVTDSLRVRTKACTCGHKWSTVEIMQDDLNRLVDQSRTVDLSTLQSAINSISTFEKDIRLMKNKLLQAYATTKEYTKL